MKEKIFDYAKQRRGPLEYHYEVYGKSNPLPYDVKSSISDCFLINYEKRISIRKLEEKFEELYKNE